MLLILYIMLKINSKLLLKNIQTNNGVEFAMKYFYASKGIMHKTTSVQNLNKIIF